MTEQQRPAGYYASHLTTRRTDGTTTEKSWTEKLTAEEATERMGPLPESPAEPVVEVHIPSDPDEKLAAGDRGYALVDNGDGTFTMTDER